MGEKNTLTRHPVYCCPLMNPVLAMPDGVPSQPSYPEWADVQAGIEGVSDLNLAEVYCGSCERAKELIKQEDKWLSGIWIANFGVLAVALVTTLAVLIKVSHHPGHLPSAETTFVAILPLFALSGFLVKNAPFTGGPFRRTAIAAMFAACGVSTVIALIILPKDATNAQIIGFVIGMKIDFFVGNFVIPLLYLAMLGGISAVRRHNVKRQPEILMFHHSALLVEATLSATPFLTASIEQRAAMCALIESSASMCEAIPGRLLGPRDPGGERLRQEFEYIASLIRGLKLTVIFPATDSVDLRQAASTLCMVSATGAYRHLEEWKPFVSEPGAPSKKEAGVWMVVRKVWMVVRTATAAVSPLALVVAIYFLAKSSPQGADGLANLFMENFQKLGLLSLAWLLLYIVRAFDPEYSKILANVKDIVSLGGGKAGEGKGASGS